MTRRALFVFNWCDFTQKKLAFILKVSTRYDELIFLIDKADDLSFSGDILVQLNTIFSAKIKIRYYLLLAPRKGLSKISHWLRWRILCPTFECIYIDNLSDQEKMKSILRVRVEVFVECENNTLLFPIEKKIRGLFITRAQPFHLGHAAILEQMKKEVEEVIIIIAMANLSHTKCNIATAGERLTMLLPYLDDTMPNRYYLIALPYSDFTMENFYELEYLLPRFDYVYTNNPKVEVLAQTAGYQVKTCQVSLSISGSLIRECILNDTPYRHLLPESVYQLIAKSQIPERLKKINHLEVR